MQLTVAECSFALEVTPVFDTPAVTDPPTFHFLVVLTLDSSRGKPIIPVTHTLLSPRVRFSFLCENPVKSLSAAGKFG